MKCTTVKISSDNEQGFIIINESDFNEDVHELVELVELDDNDSNDELDDNDSNDELDDNDSNDELDDNDSNDELDREALKTKATDLGIDFQANIRTSKLKRLIEAEEAK